MIDPKCVDINDVAHPVRDMASRFAEWTGLQDEEYYEAEDSMTEELVEFLVDHGYAKKYGSIVELVQMKGGERVEEKS